MAALSLALALTLAADAASSMGAVVVTRRSGLTPAQTAELRTQLERGLAAAGLAATLEGKTLATRLAGLGVKDTAACNGRRSCVLELARQLGVETLVAVTISRVDGDSAVALELLRVAEDQTLAKDSFVAPKGTTSLEALAAPFARAAAAALTPPPAPADTPALEAAPAPPPPALVPSEPPAAPLVTATPPARSHATGLVLGGAGLAAIAASVALLAVSFGVRGTLQPDGDYGGQRVANRALSEEAALARAAEADGLTTAGAVAGAVGAGLLVGAALAW